MRRPGRRDGGGCERREGKRRDDHQQFLDPPLVENATGLGEMRNFLIVRSAHALIAIGGGVGTLSEIALAQRIGKPVVGLHDSFRNAVDIPRVERAADAVRWALEHAGGAEV